MNADLTGLQINRSKNTKIKKTYMQILYFYLNVKFNDKNPDNPANILDSKKKKKTTWIKRK